MFKNIDNSIPGVTIQEILKLQEIIDGELPQDYKDFLGNYGFVSLQGRDLFGLGDDKFFNTFNETKELQSNFNLSKNFVVLENLGVEVMYVVLNTSNGCVYEWTPSEKSKKIYESFTEFVEKEF